MTPHALREAAAPLLLLAGIAVTGLIAVDVWFAAGVAAVLRTGTWDAPPVSFTSVARLLGNGPGAILVDGAEPIVFLAVLVLAATVGAVGAMAGFGVLRRVGTTDPRPLLRGRDLGDLAGREALERARTLRPGAPGLVVADQGLRLLSIDGRSVWMSWEDVALVIMGPRANKTSAIAVPAVLAAPGLVVATSNKADLWALTARMRLNAGPVWVFDPQRIAHAPQTWWWNPLRAVTSVPAAERLEAAARLAGHFAASIGGERRDPFFHAAGEQLLTLTLLAAAVSGATMREVVAWLQPGRRDAIAALDRADAVAEAADLEATLAGADVTTKGIFQTARTATTSLTSERIVSWAGLGTRSTPSRWRPRPSFWPPPVPPGWTECA